MKNRPFLVVKLWRLAGIFVCICLYTSIEAKTIYVKPSGDDTNGGTSWSDAYQTVQKALAEAVASDEIWVAAGTYKPTSGTDRTVRFQLKNQVGLYGGFAGTESARSERNVAASPTILSGDIGVVGDNTDNTYNVVYAENVNASTTLDGFTITAGNANGGNFPVSGGGGIVIEAASPIIANCQFIANRAKRGGGCFNIESTAVIRNCTFTQNLATSSGGAMFNNESSPVIENCLIAGNDATNFGGALYSYTFNTNEVVITLRNCVITGNRANDGGALYNQVRVRATNCTFSGNQATYTGSGSGVAYIYKPPEIGVDEYVNCILWGNSGMFYGTDIPSLLTYCIVQETYAGTGNLTLNPLFQSQPAVGLNAGGDFRLQGCSPAINAGLNSANTTLIDMDGNARIANGTIDMGAYEMQTLSACCPTGNVIYVSQNATGANDGSSWQNAFTTLDQALELLKSCSVSTEVRLAAGTYKPASGTAFVLNRQNVLLLGGFPSDGGIRNPAMNPVILAAEIKLLQNAQLDGIVVVPAQ